MAAVRTVSASIMNDPKPAREGYRGLIPAAYTPFASTGELWLDAVPAIAARCRADGAPAVFIAGTTGESHSLTTDERRGLTERWAGETGNGLDLIVHVGTNTRHDAVTLAAHARDHGAVAVSAMAPSYFKPATVEDLVEFLAPVAAAASPLPFYFYDIPALTGVAHPTDRFLEAARGIENLAGVKFTSSDTMRMQSCLRFDDGRYEILFGSDENLLVGLALGCVGAVGSTYNYASALYQPVIEAFEAGDLVAAREAQHASVRLVEVLIEHGVLRAGRAIMKASGVDCGPPRSPLRAVDGAEARVIGGKLLTADLPGGYAEALHWA